MISSRCKSCNKELIGQQTKTVSCGCPNMAIITGDKISAVDLKQVVMLNSTKEIQKTNVLAPEDLDFQEQRRKRKFRKLEFEIK